MTLDPSKNSTFKGSTCFVAEALPDILEIVLTAPSIPFWARGESKEHDLPCQSSIARTGHAYTNKKLYLGEGSLTVGEFKAISLCYQHYVSGNLSDELFSRFVGTRPKEIDPSTNDLLYWASLAQHHNDGQRYPTRLLDVTSDILVATYFACISNLDEDGYVFYGNFSCNNLVNGGKVAVKGSYFDIVEIEDLESPKDPWQPSQDTLCLAPLPYPNRRMTVQRGALVWSRSPENGYYNQMRQFTIKIPSEYKGKFLVGLDRLGYNQLTMFPDELPLESSISR